MATAANLPAQTREVHPIVRLNNDLEKRADEFRKALPSHISPEKLQRTIVTAAQNSPDLLAADRQSLIVACMKAAQDGLLPDGREAALVIFNTREKDAQGKFQNVKLVQYMPMVYGLRKKILQSGDVAGLQVGVVYRAEVEAGAFVYEEGTEAMLRHRPMIEIDDAQMSDENIVAAYSIARMKDGSILWDVMRRSEINKVRQMSQTGAVGKTVKFGQNAGNAIAPKGPWVDWFAEMAKKTVLRRHSKMLPMSGDIIMDVEGREIEHAISTSNMLAAVEPDAPTALPDNSTMGEQLGDEIPAFDGNTGEVIDQKAEPEPARNATTGMTEVDEDTARALDQRQAAEQTMLDIDGPAEVQAEEESPAAAALRALWDRLEVASTKQQAAGIEADFLRDKVGFDDELAAAFQRTLDKRMKALPNEGADK